MEGKDLKLYLALLDGKNSLTTTIINLARSLEQKGLDRFHVGIQMVQIGNNARETDTLKKLDDELATNHNVRVSIIHSVYLRSA